jgi:hypothetical protein
MIVLRTCRKAVHTLPARELLAVLICAGVYLSCCVDIALSQDSDPQTIVQAHNNRRNNHCVPAVTWSAEAAAAAQQWANGCQFQLVNGSPIFVHDQNRAPFGENLAWGTPSLAASAAVEMWYAESAMYDFNNPVFSPATGHFTQLVWLGTREVGCAVAACNVNGQQWTLWACRYSPAGNVTGQFTQNVTRLCVSNPPPPTAGVAVPSPTEIIREMLRR